MEVEKFNPKTSKVLVVYVIPERAFSYFSNPTPHKKFFRTLYRENIEFFFKHGEVNNDLIKTCFVINGNKKSLNLDFSNKNVIERENTYGDFAAYTHALETYGKNNFDFFIFINDTCRGPFLPDYLNKETSWQDLFLNKIDKEIKLVGPCWNWTNTKRKKGNLHIQSSCWATDKKGIEILTKWNVLKTNFYKELGPSDFLDKDFKDRYINWCEIGMSQVIKKNGYKIKPFMMSQYEFPQSQISSGDCQKIGAYYGSTIHPFDCMFIKTNRILNTDLKNISSWQNSKLEESC